MAGQGRSRLEHGIRCHQLNLPRSAVPFSCPFGLPNPCGGALADRQRPDQPQLSGFHDLSTGSHARRRPEGAETRRARTIMASRRMEGNPQAFPHGCRFLRACVVGLAIPIQRARAAQIITSKDITIPTTHEATRRQRRESFGLGRRRRSEPSSGGRVIRKKLRANQKRKKTSPSPITAGTTKSRASPR